LCFEAVHLPARRLKAQLGWQARYGIDDMVRDSWHWQKQNPDGYPD